MLGDQEQWDPAKLTASLQLLDGTLVQVGKSTEASEDILSRFRAVLGVVTLSIVVIALTGGWLATQSALRPIRQLATAVRRVISTGQIDQRVPVGPHDDEIDELTRLFNEMLEKIEGLVTGMHGALDNVSHDLRTPLTRLRGTAEMALAGQADAEGYREALAGVWRADRVLVMLNTLMDISEAEAVRALAPRAVRLRISPRAVDLYRDVAEARRHDEVKTAGDAVVSADRVRLEQVAANLLDNAVKYTPAGGHVLVEVLPDGGRGVLRVRDSGIGIPADELPHIFERLYRGDVSRTERGLGLGLSLVKAVVEAHGGMVTVESKPGQGSSFTVVLNSAHS